MSRSAPQLVTRRAMYRLNLASVELQHPSLVRTNPHPQPFFSVTFSALFQRILEEFFEGWVIVTHILGLCTFHEERVVKWMRTITSCTSFSLRCFCLSSNPSRTRFEALSRSCARTIFSP